jgi:hypothetical protein
MCKAVLSVSGFLDAGGFLMFRKEYSVQASGSVSVLRLKWGVCAEMDPKKDLFNHWTCPLFEVFCSLLSMGWCK